MGTTSSNFLPSLTGQDIGSAGQRWDAYNQILDVAGNATLAADLAVAGNTTVAAVSASGVITASAGVVGAVTGAVTGNVIGNVTGNLTSPTANPASAGAVRMAPSDSIKFRNNANSGDLTAVSLDASNYVQVGDASSRVTVLSTYLNLPASNATIVQPTTGYSLNLTTANVTTGTAGTIAVTAGNGGGGSGSGTGGSISLSAGPAGTLGGDGGSVNISAGSAAAGNAGNINLLGGTINFQTAITKVNNLVTVGPGVAGIVAKTDLTGQTAAISATTLYTPTSTGLFRLHARLIVTSAAGTSSTLGGVTITYTDGDSSVAQSQAMALATSAGAIATTSAGNTTTTTLDGSSVIYAKTGVAIQYAVGYVSSPASAMTYTVHLRLEAL